MTQAKPPTPLNTEPLSPKGQLILQYALEQLRSGQLFDMNIDDFAAAAGVSKMTIYKHFESKQGLVEAAALRFLEQQISPDFAAMSQAQRIDALLQMQLERSQVGIKNLIELRNKGSEAYLRGVTKVEQRGSQILHMIFREAQANDSLAQFSADEMLALVQVLIDGIIQHHDNPHAIAAVSKTFHLLMSCLRNTPHGE